MHSPNLQLLPKDFNIDFDIKDEQLASMLTRYNSSNPSQPFIRLSERSVTVIEFWSYHHSPEIVPFTSECCSRWLQVSVRSAFMAREGHQLISADYNQLELRILAHLSSDPLLLRLLGSTVRNVDVFRLVGAQLFARDSPEQVTTNERQQAKQVLFYPALFYS